MAEKKAKTVLEAMQAKAEKKFFEAVSKASGNNVTNAEELIENIDALAETKQVDGVDKLFLPLEWKKELFRLAYPDGMIQTEVTWVGQKFATAVARVYANDSLLSEGQACQAVSLVPAFSSVDAQISQCESIARGRAESKALYNAGIASWIRGDIENTDRVDEDKPAPEPVDKTAEIAKAIEVKDEAAEEIPFEDVVNETKRTTMIHGGKYDGKTIGDLEVENPALLFKMLNKHLDESSSYHMSDELFDAIMEVGRDHVADAAFIEIMKAEGVGPEIFTE